MPKISPFIILYLIFIGGQHTSSAQVFYLGADLSYVNEMEDCGAVYKEQQQPKDPFAIFADHACNIARFRIWHTPHWYDQLNEGKRYSDLADVKKSISRSKKAGMTTLLDFHLSDDWADPGDQLIPAAWLPVVDNLPILNDSLYNYIYRVLAGLDEEGLLPEMVQIGNETNRGILLSPEEDEKEWSMDWKRNAGLFQSAIKAVRKVSDNTGKDIKIVIHMANPAEAQWMFKKFTRSGVKDFDIIGISYYWAWHAPTEISEVGEVITQLKKTYPDKEVMIVETGYAWTTENVDSANNIISKTHPDYEPASPENQRKWLIDLTKEVVDRGGLGVIYWEPAWVSSDCWTQWGKGSHQDHAIFFDANNNLIEEGGIQWLSHDYGIDSETKNK